MLLSGEWSSVDDGAKLIEHQTQPIARRTLVAGGLAGLAGALGGCSTRVAQAPEREATTVRSLTARVPFVIGARGGARDWPEMTVFGFEQAATIPRIQAMELLVARTADGVLVCSADFTTKRVTGRDLVIAEETWASLSKLRVHGRDTKEPSQPERPFARFDDIIDAFIDRFVIFVEPLSNEAVTNLMPKLISLHAPNRIVWKQPITSTRFGEAKLHGFTTWGYALSDPAHLGKNLRRFASSDEIDMIGASVTKPKVAERVLEVAERYDKVPVAWNVRSGSELTRAVDQGFAGISTTAVREIVAIAR